MNEGQVQKAKAPGVKPKTTTTTMKRVLLLSKTFPAHHRRKGEQTYFFLKISNKLIEIGLENALNAKVVHSHNETKGQTIRAGKRWKAGDIADIREWTGLPYRTKQRKLIEVTVQQVFDISVYRNEDRQELNIVIDCHLFGEEIIPSLAANDGLSLDDFMSWFRYFKQPFDGQIICFDHNINYY